MATTNDTDLGELTFERIYPAPAALVFECMTTPEHLAQFWGPVGMTTPVENIVVEPRVGGRFETLMIHEESGGEHQMIAEYVEFDPPHRLAWAEPGPEPRMISSITFNDRGDGTTEVVIEQTNVPAMYRSPEAQAGLQSSFDKCAAYLATLV